jgi:hypothetical protein
MKLTDEKYEEMGFIKLGNGAVQDRHGAVYYPKKHKRPLRAIKAFCKECFGMDRRERETVSLYEDIRDCVDPMCPLFEFRNGKNPFLSRELTEEEKEVARERLDKSLGRGESRE